MSVPVAVPSVGTLILALAGSELSYDHLYKQACWLFERVKRSASFLLYCVGFLLICARQDKSLEDGGMKRKFKVCGDD